MECIKISGAREHNLKNITVSIPRNKLVVITGPSGSGKSSLAFDTIYAEGQRRYIESLSSYARLFLDQLHRADVDYIEGLPPAIAVEQRTAAASPRSIIATTTEIYDYLRLLFCHVGCRFCPDTGVPLTSQTTTEIVDALCSLKQGSPIIILAPLVDGKKGEFRDVFDKVARAGFIRVRVDGELIELDPKNLPRLDPKRKHVIEAVVDRLIVDSRARVRIADSVETALEWGRGIIKVLHADPQVSIHDLMAVSNHRTPAWKETVYSTRFYSPGTGKLYEPLSPKHFSYNSPDGACEECQGLGQSLEFDPQLVVSDSSRSIANGAIAPWRRLGKRLVNHYIAAAKTVLEKFNCSIEAPWEKLPEQVQQILLFGSNNVKNPPLDKELETDHQQVPYEGIIPTLQRLYKESTSATTKQILKAFMIKKPCPKCLGQRLKPEILSVRLIAEGFNLDDFPEVRATDKPLKAKLPGVSIMGICAMTIDQAWDFLNYLSHSLTQHRIAKEILTPLLKRLNCLRELGLGYLALNRECATLSGGEAQRIRLATQIGAGLVGVAYILDEPTIGLHPVDMRKLIKALKELRDIGNSVIVVEHDPDVIREADYVIDLGPGAGAEGGYVVACGTLEEVLKSPTSLTAKYLRGDYEIPLPRSRVPPDESRGWLEVIGATAHNLKNINVRIPIGTITCVTGVSGSGKSTLVDDVLRKALFRKFYGAKEPPGPHKAIRGYENFDKVIVVDQTPIGRTPRSNPATYTGMFNLIRELFAKLPAAKVRGYDASRFSFNIPGGRCERCSGDGVITVDMQFLPPAYVPCEACGGKRYNRETLEITYRGKNIADVLDMTAEEAAEFFKPVAQIAEICQTLVEVGLGYIKLGQPATTLSGGEAQRVKLAAELARKSTGSTLYIMDEPTTGLHMHDVSTLLRVLFKLRQAGNTIIIIEHNLHVIKCADWIIDLGPGGGDKGGQVVAEGTPEQIAACPQSYTGQYLRPLLQHK